MSSGWTGECPLPNSPTEFVTLAHGGGGRLMQQLLHEVILAKLTPGSLATQHDGAILPWPGDRIAFTTDSYVVKPLFFPGGDIGKLAVLGTINDLAMCGARPLFLSISLIIEEGLELEVLQNVLTSMRETADACDVALVTGDTKVVDRGKGDGIFINTAGIGRVSAPSPIGPQSIRADDLILLSGDLGRHGIAIMAAREGFEFESTIVSDLAPLHRTVQALLQAGVTLHCLRDLTRGGLAAALVELATASRLGMEINEQALVVQEPVRGACELFGYDPIHVANEGCFIAYVSPFEARLALDCMHACGHKDATVIGKVSAANEACVTLRNNLGVQRPIYLPNGEQLPRIC